MPEFLLLSRPLDALQSLLETLPDIAPIPEEIDTTLSLGRVLFEDIQSPHPLPEFPRSSVDGYALKAHNTFGVSETMPGYLDLVGEVLMGEAPEFVISSGTCALIHTGGMVPEGADAIIMLENTQIVDTDKDGRRNTTIHANATQILESSEIEITHAVAVGENVILVGEDVAFNQVVLKKGIVIRSMEIGGCMALGLTKLRVANKPIIAIISTGNELISPNQSPHTGQVRDVNSYTLAALIEKSGGKPVRYGIYPDKFEVVKSAAEKALKECDAVVVTAGSSASARDMTAEVINSLGAPGVLVHGVNVRPGKPTILAVCGGKAVIGLPGNPVSALIIAGLFVVPVIEKLLGVNGVRPQVSVLAKLSINVPSQSGREDWVAVRLIKKNLASGTIGEGSWLAEPVFGKSNLIFSLATADGLVRIPPEATGMSAGEMVEVLLLG